MGTKIILDSYSFKATRTIDQQIHIEKVEYVAQSGKLSKNAKGMISPTTKRPTPLHHLSRIVC